MVIIAKKLTLTEYLTYDDDTDNLYELEDGYLSIMSPESNQNNLIALYLLSEFLKIVPFRLVCHKDTEIVTAGNRVRLPDLMIITEELLTALYGKRATITPEMPAPALVIEVVSPGKVNEDRDYRYKRSEYAARGILEYWIVDPQSEKVTLLTLVDGLYEEKIFQGDKSIVSHTFPEFNLIAGDIFPP
ncbi:Uma2 family endonuclease [Gloeocapsa sp. PCC 73106]|uniref:Uma2 family endonuclease n=1 Tax=Gloeocapsa sp. PCC 73106 TaxID=102232 RepID=UPI0002AD16F0|nr:Uma2 family endonuclease [Gloeocapsa sp. PCC 73106]ELR97001.1 hypothetical protein GLO73106DRAFT_00008040 [Gloeocapsa sp. PCC 73106]